MDDFDLNDEDLLNIIAQKRKRSQEAQLAAAAGNPAANAIAGGLRGLGAAMMGKDGGEAAAQTINQMQSQNLNRAKLLALDDTSELKSLTALAKLRQKDKPPSLFDISKAGLKPIYDESGKIISYQIDPSLQKPKEKDPLAEALKEETLRSKIEKRKEAAQKATPSGKLAGISGEVKNKIGMIADALKNHTEYEKAYAAGSRPEYLDADTRLIGGIMSDTPITLAARKMNETIGRLNSGGVIGDEELQNFRAMIPRPADAPEIQQKKLQDFREAMEFRLSAFGFDPSELTQVKGFDANVLGYDPKSTQIRQQIAGGVPPKQGATIRVQKGSEIYELPASDKQAISEAMSEGFQVVGGLP